MKEITLYKNLPPNSNVNNSLGQFTSTEIFTKGGTDEVWGNSDERCNPFSFSPLDASMDYREKNTKEHIQNSENNEDIQISLSINEVEISEKKTVLKNSLHLNTDMDQNCEWVGMGIGWDGWQPKDLSDIVDKAAIEFMARVDGPIVYKVPIVFILEDYESNQCYATANYLGIDGGVITNDWTKVTIPLSSFSYLTNTIDLTNIKQLLMQCYDKIDIYIDNIKIIPYVHKYKRLNPNLTVRDSILPINIFSENLVSYYGINEQYCQNIILNQETSYNGGNFLEVNVDLQECKWNQLGISWNDWLYTDLSDNIYDLHLEFDVNVYKNSDTRIIFEDYSGKKISIELESYTDNEKTQNWEKVRIPFRQFPIRKSDINLKKIKNILFSFGDKTKLKLDNIKLTN